MNTEQMNKAGNMEQTHKELINEEVNCSTTGKLMFRYRGAYSKTILTTKKIELKRPKS